MGLLTHEEKQFFKDNGYLVKRDVLPEDLMERAVDGLWHGVWADRSDPQTWVNAEPKKPESKTPTLHRSIVYDYGVFDMAEEMAGKGRLTEWAEPTPLFRYPTGADQWSKPSGGHVDGYGQKDLTVAGFTIAATVYLCDIKPRSGGFCVWPGTHVKMADYFRSHSLLSVNRQFLDPSEPATQIHMGTIIDLPDPMEITGPAGTVIFWHGLMVHSASKNCSRNIRMGLFTRFKWKNWNELQFETPDDMWEYWEGLNGR